jgi:hypothetical protein
MAHQLNVRVPASLRDDARKAAEAEGVSMNQFCAMAIARAVGEWEARRFFAGRCGGLKPKQAREQLRELLHRVRD